MAKSEKVILRDQNGVEHEVSGGDVESKLRAGWTRQNGTNEVLAHVEDPSQLSGAANAQEQLVDPLQDSVDGKLADGAGETNEAAESHNQTRTRTDNPADFAGSDVAEDNDENRK